MAATLNSEVIRFPFPIPRDFTAQIGYDNYQLGAFLADAVRGLTGSEPEPFTPRRFVGLYWEMSGDELAWSDGLHSFCGAEYAPFLEIWYRSDVYQWSHEYRIDFGSSGSLPRHWLIIDRETAESYVAPVKLAREIVRAQSLLQEMPRHMRDKLARGEQIQPEDFF